MTDYNSLLLDIFICTIGLLLHLAMKWGEARQASKLPINLRDYLKSVPAQTAVSVLATIAVFTVMTAMDWMNPGAAFASGYIGNSMADNLATQFSSTPRIPPS